MQKFEESNEALSERRNIIVMADEAHRGQYGLNEKVVVKQKDNGEVEAKTVIGTARIIRDTLPNATYIDSPEHRSPQKIAAHEKSSVITSTSMI